jgi:hypothetical protein
MLEPDFVAYLVEQARRWFVVHRRNSAGSLIAS